MSKMATAGKQPVSVSPALFLTFMLAIACCDAITPPPGHSLGQPWPMPKSFVQTNDLQQLNQDTFQFKVGGTDCDLLRAAISRYYKIVFYGGWESATLRFRPRYPAVHVQDDAVLPSLVITITGACETWPSLGMDESYSLSIQTGSASLTSKGIWGAIRGLETFSQIVYRDSSGLFMVKNTELKDAPRFSHRGVLLDTSRHFLPKQTIFANLEAMAYNKMNVLHWHIVDENSFPYQSYSFPDLSAKGAYDPITHVYTQEDVKEVLEFARIRGIRVVPEFDTPGHTRAWGLGQPNLLTKCCDSGGHFNGNYGPIDPTYDGNYAFLNTLVKELKQVFPDHYLHLGGDEVSFSCWQSNPNITKFMQQQGFGTDYSKLENYYEQKLLDIVNSYNSGYMVWQEVFDNNVQVRPDTVINVWKIETWQKEMANVTNAKYKALLSAPWYLDKLAYGAQWRTYYRIEPLDFNASAAQEALVMGGEACLWAEYVDATNVEARLWPRASAVAERLWSPREVNDTSKAEPRMEEHRCRMVLRGISAEPPSGPNYCKYEQRPATNPLWY